MFSWEVEWVCAVLKVICGTGCFVSSCKGFLMDFYTGNGTGLLTFLCVCGRV